MCDNLNKIHKNLSPECQIYNGHEYTLQNLKWGALAEPTNQKIAEYIGELEGSQSEICTLPTTPRRESEINVFYRAAIMSENQLGLSRVEYLRVLREAKNENSGDLRSYAFK